MTALHSPPRLCVLAFPRLARLIQAAAAEHDTPFELIIENRRFSDAVAQAHALIARGEVDGFISAGANGAQLRRQLDLPVTLVQVSGFDIMAALAQASRLSRRKPARIGLITYEQTSSALGELSHLLKAELHQARYDDATSVHAQVENLRQRGVDVLIGPSLVVEAAEQAGLASVFLYTPEAARRALDDALAAARVRRIEQDRRQQLAELIAQLRDGVLAIDPQQRIWLANPAMCDMTGASAATITRQTLPQLIPDLDASAVLAPGGTSLRRVLTLGRQRLLAHLTPLNEGPARHGALLTLQAASSIERAERDLHRHARHHAPRARHSLDDLIGPSHTMQTLRALAARFAPLELTVLIHGESGSGKELVAQGIHNASPRAREAFIAINCAAMPENLLESELFGYDEGAFTGAAKGGKPGLLESAHRGTVFLDEIGDMPPALQVRLLRVLQEREVLRVGGREPIPIDVRIIAATHRDLPQRIREGSFRQDLYYRVNGLAISVPPLRERREDLPALSQHLLSRRRGSAHTLPDWLYQQFIAASAHYDWPGNVRELENMLDRLSAVAADLPTPSGPAMLALLLPELSPAQPPPAPLQQARQYAEQNRIDDALAASHGKQQAAARLLGISRTTLWRKRQKNSGPG